MLVWDKSLWINSAAVLPGQQETLHRSGVSDPRVQRWINEGTRFGFPLGQHQLPKTQWKPAPNKSLSSTWRGRLCLQQLHVKSGIKYAILNCIKYAKTVSWCVFTWGTQLHTLWSAQALRQGGQRGVTAQAAAAPAREEQQRRVLADGTESWGAPTQPARGLEMLQLAPSRKEQQTMAFSAAWAKHGGSRASREPCSTAVPSELQWHLLCVPLLT